MVKNYLFAFVLTLLIMIIPLSSFSHHGWSYYRENVEKNVEIYKTGVDVDSYAKLVFDNEFTSFIGTSFKKDLGKRTIIKGDSGEITIEDSWHGNPSIISISGKNNEIIKINAKTNIYSYEIEIFSKNFLENNFEIKYPGVEFNETFLNMKILDDWLN